MKRKFKASPVNFMEKTGSIGVMGTARGVGTTHLAIIIANYCANVLGLNTAAVEYNQHRDYMKICDEAGIKTDDIRHFTLSGVDFYSCHSPEHVARIYAQDYEFLILDLDYADRECFQEFLRCDLKIAVCSTAKWKIAKAYQCIQEISYNRLLTASFMAEPGTKKRLEHQLQVRLWDIPTETNPFCLTAGNLLWLKSFLESGKTFCI